MNIDPAEIGLLEFANCVCAGDRRHGQARVWHGGRKGAAGYVAVLQI